MKSLVIIGAGGHGLVVAETAELMQQWHTIYYLDDKYPALTVVNNIPVIDQKTFAQMSKHDTEIVVAIGDNAIRYDLLNSYLTAGYICPVIIHPDTCVSRSASIGAGTVIFASAVINAKAILGVACIVNTAAVIEHQCVLGAAVHVSPTACLAGNVTIGANTWIGAGAVIINDKHVGHNVVVGAGAVVVADIPSDQRVIGVPAKTMLAVNEFPQDK